MPSRLRTPRPPSLPSSIAIFGETTPSIAEAISGSSSRCGPSFQPMSTSWGSRVRLEGTIAMSSNPYACRAFFPRPISISTLSSPLQSEKPRRKCEGLGRKIVVAALSQVEGDRSTDPGRQITTSVAADRLELRHLDPRHEPSGLARLEAAGAELQRGGGACGDRAAERLFVGAAVESSCDEGREQNVARADSRHGIDPRCDRAEADHLPVGAQQRPAAGLARDQHVARAELGDRLEPHEEVVVVVELLAYQELGLALVRRDQQGLGLDREAKRLPLAVEHRLRAAPVELANGLGVEVVV